MSCVFLFCCSLYSYFVMFWYDGMMYAKYVMQFRNGKLLHSYVMFIRLTSNSSTEYSNITHECAISERYEHFCGGVKNSQINFHCIFILNQIHFVLVLNMKWKFLHFQILINFNANRKIWGFVPHLLPTKIKAHFTDFKCKNRQIWNWMCGFEIH